MIGVKTAAAEKPYRLFARYTLSEPTVHVLHPMSKKKTMKSAIHLYGYMQDPFLWDQ